MTDPEAQPTAFPTATYAQRLAALCAFLGAAPLLWLGRKRQPEYVTQHVRQALAVFALLVLVLTLFFVAVGVISYTMVYAREIYEGQKIEGRLLSVVRKIFLCWIVFWGFGATLAAAGSWREMPLVGWLAQRDWLARISAMVWALAILLVLTAGGLSVHGEMMMRSDAAPGKAYFLYEDVNKFPRWLFMLGFNRMAGAAERCYGQGQTIALELTHENIERALREGSFVFIGSHGTKKGLMVDGGYFRVEDIDPEALSPTLEYVYMTGCDQKQPWIDALAPAEVVAFDRLSTVIEHVWWMWFTGPRIICRVAQGSES